MPFLPVQASFPEIKELDLRQMPPNASHGPCFAPLTTLQRIYISSVQRPSDPQKLVAEVFEFAAAVEVNSCGPVHPKLLIFGKGLHPGVPALTH